MKRRRRYAPNVVARYGGGLCAACREPVDAGQPIINTARGWVHAACPSAVPAADTKKWNRVLAGQGLTVNRGEHPSRRQARRLR